jgi:protoporphyrinogen oxidase
MRVAVLGAGMTGLTAARRLALAGHDVDVYERWPGLGGQAATFDAGGGVLLERYYHHLFTSDRHIVALLDELGLHDELQWHASSVSVLVDGRQWPFTTPADLLRFTPLPPAQRLRMGATVLALNRLHRRPASYEDVTASDWIRRHMGEQAWELVWGPLLRGKFGARADEVAMVWLWSKLALRRRLRAGDVHRERLGYPRGTWETLFAALAAAVEGCGGRVLIDRPVARVTRDDGGFLVTPAPSGSFRTGHDPRAYTTTEPAERYDRVLATVPSDVFEQVCAPGLLPPGYVERLRSVEYFAAVCLLLELARPFSPYYWTNVADRDVPFVGLIEQTNLLGPERYGGRRFLYVANYAARGDRLLAHSLDELLAHYEPGLRRVNPAFSRDWVRDAWLFREPAAQPLVTVGYRERMPRLQTGVPGLVLANTTQVYPEDRGTNYAVRLGDEAARELLA